MSNRPAYPSYTLEEKIEVLRKTDEYWLKNNNSIPPDYYLRLVHGFDRKDVENEQLRRLLLQSTNTVQNVVKETILEMNKPTQLEDKPTIDDLVVKHTKKITTKSSKKSK